MHRYVARRLLQAVGVLFAAYTVSFVVLKALPGDPVSAMAGASLNSSGLGPAQLAQLRAQYGFDRPLAVQYLDGLGQAVHGDFGTSVATGRSVTDTIVTALPPTLQLGGAALLLAVLLGGGLAIIATGLRARWLRQLLLSLPPLAASIPSFWAGLMLVQLLSFRARLFPAFGNHGFAGLVLPAVTLAMPSAALIAQVLAKSIVTTGELPFVTTARAKGASGTRVHLRHVARNALLPALTVVGVLVGQVLASAVVVETVFSRNGLGRVTADAVSLRDIPVVQGVVLFGAFVFVLTNLVVDVVYPMLDKRIVLGTNRSEP